MAFSQSATTSVRGVVKDPSSALVPGATITLVDKANGKMLSARTNNAGSYAFLQIEPAKYLITVSATGFGYQKKTAELLVNQPATIDFMLAVQASTVTVDVSAEAQTLNLTDATIGNSVGNATIEALPMEGRDPVSLLSLQPGVLYIGSETTDSRQGAVAADAPIRATSRSTDWTTTTRQRHGIQRSASLHDGLHRGVPGHHIQRHG